MIKYFLILQVKDWETILILGLEMLNCHTKGLEMSGFTRFLWVNFKMLGYRLV